MDNLQESILLKYRGIMACVSTGYNLFTTNFKSIFQQTWLTAILYAFACSCLYVAYTLFTPEIILASANNFAPGTVVQQMMDIPTIAIFMSIIAIGALFETLFYSHGIALLRQHRDTGRIPVATRWINVNFKTFWFTFKGIISTLAVALVLTSVACGTILLIIYVFRECGITPGVYTLIFIELVAMIILSVLLLPIIYPAAHYLFSDNQPYWPSLHKKYATGFRHFGRIFGVTFICILITALANITVLPMVIFNQANANATVSMYMGDPFAMPPSYLWIAGVIGFICGMLQAYIRLSCFFPVYYLFGAIQIYENERAEATNNSQQP